METVEIVCLCIIIAGLFFGIGYGIAYFVDMIGCHHQFEEVLKVYNGGKYAVVHMCKKCGKRKITKV